MSNLYILDEHDNPVREPDVLKWAAWFETAHRHVSQDLDEGPGGQQIRISTIFLGIDHNFGMEGPPVLWETMVFGGPLDGEQDRYTSKADAVRGHQAMCQRVTAMLRQ